jgi:hypothetical protein
MLSTEERLSRFRAEIVRQAIGDEYVRIFQVEEEKRKRGSSDPMMMMLKIRLIGGQIILIAVTFSPVDEDLIQETLRLGVGILALVIVVSGL